MGFKLKRRVDAGREGHARGAKWDQGGDLERDRGRGGGDQGDRAEPECRGDQKPRADAPAGTGGQGTDH